MFQIAVERLNPLLPPERILVVASEELTPILREQAPDLPDDNFIVEPLARGTGPAVGLGAVVIRERDPEAVMAVLTADHYIGNELMFRRALAAGYEVAKEGGIVTLGITPDHPSTGFGYIERGTPAQTIDGIEVFELVQFHEKPDRETARQYVTSGQFSWNSGMFIWQAARVMAEFEQHAPSIYADLSQIVGAQGTPAFADVLERVWPGIRKETIDYAIMEHVRGQVYVIPVEMGWSDVGNFSALYDVLSSDGRENVVHGNHDSLLLDTQGTLVISNRLVATIGLDDVVIIDTDDALLVCRRDRAQDIRKVVDQLTKDKRERLL